MFNNSKFKPTDMRDEADIMHGNCVNYANFHIETMGKEIIDRKTLEVKYKPAIFLAMTIPAKRKLLTGCNPDYVLVNKSK